MKDENGFILLRKNKNAGKNIRDIRGEWVYIMDEMQGTGGKDGSRDGENRFILWMKYKKQEGNIGGQMRRIALYYRGNIKSRREKEFEEKIGERDCVSIHLEHYTKQNIVGLISKLKMYTQYM